MGFCIEVQFFLWMNQYLAVEIPLIRLLFFWRLAGGVGSGNSTVKHAREVGHLYQSEVFKKSFGCNINGASISHQTDFWIEIWNSCVFKHLFVHATKS